MSSSERTIYFPGIPDDMFARGQIPMTKEEVRAVTLSKLRVDRDSVVWDIGAGTGSISVEAALLASSGHVYAIERNPGGIRLIEANQNLFGLSNLTIVPGSAPGVLLDLPRPDRVVVGGSGGVLDGILSVVKDRLVAGGIVIVNCVTVETLYKAIHHLQMYGFRQVEGIGISITRLKPTGSYHMLTNLNPVFVVSAIQPQG